MNTQTLLLMLTFGLLAILFATPKSGMPFGMAFSVAYYHDAATAPFAGLYERVTIVFEKSLDDIEKTVNDGIAEFGKQLNHFKKELDDAGGKKASTEELEALKKEHKAKFDELEEKQSALEKEAGRLKDANIEKKSLGGLLEEKVTRDFVKKSFNLPQGHEEKGLIIDLKAVSIQTTGYSLTGANATLLRAFSMEPGVAKDPNAPFFVQDLIDTGASTEHTIFWNERVLVEGGAAQTAENARFPQLSATYVKKSANSKKTAVYTKLTEEMIEDVDFIQSEIQSELLDGPLGMRATLESQLISGDGTGENHTGLFTLATAFAKPAGFDTLVNPSNFDVIMAASLQVEVTNYAPTHVLVSPAAFANMNVVRDNQNNYVIPPFVTASGLQINGLVVVKSNRLSGNNFLICAPQLAKLRVNRGLTIRFFEQNEDDALTDRRTITASMRGAFYVKTPDLKAFVKGDFATAKTAIKTV